MLTPFGRQVVTVASFLLLCASSLYFFVLTHRAQDFLCERATVCISVKR